MLTLVTRAADEAQRTADALRAAGHEPLLAPLTEIRILPMAAPAGRFDGVVATSAHAFAALAGLPEAARAALAGAPLFAVGARTGQAGRAAGFSDVRIAAGDGAGLVELARLTGPPAGRYLYLAGRDRKPAVEAGLAALGARAITVETYAAEPVGAFDPQAAARLAAAPAAAALHFSRRSAALCLTLAEAAGLGPRLRRIVHVAISADAAAPLIAAGLPAIVAKAPNEAELIAALPD